MEKNEHFLNFLNRNPKEKMFYQNIGKVLDTKINLFTIKRLINIGEDIDYLFKIRDRNTLQKIRNTLRIIQRHGSLSEKQITGYILGKNLRFDCPFIAIACHSCFSFTRRRKPTILNYKFKTIEDNIIFRIYWIKQVKQELISTFQVDTQKLHIKYIYVLLYITGLDYLIEDIVDRFMEDHNIFTGVMDNFTYGNVYLANKLFKMSRREKLLISRIKFDKTRLLMYYFTNSVVMFLKERKEIVYHDNMSLNELCLEIDVAQSYGPGASLKRKNETEKDLLRNIKYAWLRILLISDHFLLFLEVFEEILPDASLEHKIFKIVQKKISGTAQSNEKTFLKKHVLFKETNQCATVEMKTVLKHLNVL